MQRAAQRRGWLSVVVIGAGLVGVELVGELTAFADDVLRCYPRIRRDEVCSRSLSPRILPEIDPALAATAARVLVRRGVDIHVSTAVRAGSVPLDTASIEAATIVLTAGIVPSAAASAIPVARDQLRARWLRGIARGGSHPIVCASALDGVTARGTLTIRAGYVALGSLMAFHGVALDHLSRARRIEERHTDRHLVRRSSLLLADDGRHVPDQSRHEPAFARCTR